MRKPKAAKLSKGASLSKIKWDEKKHSRDIGGKFKHQPGSDEFKAEPFGTPKTSGVTNNDVIKLHVKANPKKAGSTAANDFAKYQDNMTVGEFKAAVGANAQGHLTHDMKKGFITIHDPKTLPPVEKELAFADYVITSKTSGVQPQDKIKLLATHNPKKPGSKAAEDFAKYKDEMTVAEFHAAVGDKSAGQGHILHDLKKGYISVHNPAELKMLKTGAKSPGQAAAEMKIGDKKLGVITANPYKPGTKNHDDFEATAKQLGLQTAEPVTTMPKGESVGGAAPAPKPGASHGLKDDDVIETYLGNKYTVAEYKKAYVHTATDIDAYIAQKIAIGDMKVIPKAPAAAPITSTTKKVAALTPQEQQTHDVMIVTPDNPYPHGSDKWIKFKAIQMSTNNYGGINMSVAKYNTTKALTPEQKTAALQGMIDDGHVKLVTPEQKAAVAAEKAKIAAAAQIKATTEAEAKIKIQKEAAALKHKLHYEQVKPADFYNAPKWSKVPGLKMPEDPNKAAHMESTRIALGLKYNSNSTNASVNSYVGSGYQTINGGLRNKKTGGYDGLGPTTKGHVKVLDNLMEETKGDAIMWRGSGMHGETTEDYLNVNNIPPPSEFTDLGYSSMSHNPRKSLGFAGSSVVTGKSKTTLFRVRVPKGSKAAFIGRRTTEQGGMQDEAEVITARGTRFKYISTTRNVDMGSYENVDIIEVEIIKDDGSLLY